MKYVFVLLFTFIALITIAQPVKLPQPSPTQTIKQNFGLGSVELSYSRPSLKGRIAFKEKSELAPQDVVWRTGANAPTTVTFSDAVTINNIAIKPGKYGLLTIPGKKAFTIIVTKDTTVNQPTAYNADYDVVRVLAPIEKLSEKVELFTMQFANITYETCDLQLQWGGVQVVLPIATNIRDRVKADVEKSEGGDKPSYQSIATYYFEIVKDNNEALAYITKAIYQASKPSFSSYLLKAKIEKELGDKAAAKTDAMKCIELANTAKNDDYVRAAKELISKL